MPPFVSFTTRSPRLRVVAFPGDGSPKLTDGLGNVETISRPLRRGLTRWTGSNPPQLTIPILLDGLRSSRSVEPDIADLERMAGYGGKEQLEVTIDSTGDKLVPHQADHKWLIVGLDEGDVVRSSNGRRVRAAYSVTLVAKIEATSEKSLAKRQGGGSHARSYRVKKGDTLRSISRKVFGTPDRWIEIRRLNGINDPRIVGTAGKKKGCIGTVLKMPR